MEMRSIVGRTDYEQTAVLAAEYLNERFVQIGAIVEPSNDTRDCMYLVVCQGQLDVRQSSVVVESCRAFISGCLRAKDFKDD